MAMFIRKHNSADILWLLSSQIFWPYFDIAPLCYSVTYDLAFLQLSCFLDEVMASLWLEIFLGLILISPLWVAQHAVTCIILFFTAKLLTFLERYQLF